MFILVSVVILVTIASMSLEIRTINEQNPSLTKYNHLQDLYPNALKCPCLNVANPYRNFTLLSPLFHQVCSSIFVSEFWLSLTEHQDAALVDLILEWYGLGGRQFQLLSAICQLANKTIDDSLLNFGAQLFITSNLLTESDFNVQVNTTINELITSLLTHFNLLIRTVHLFTQVNQPYTLLGNANVAIGQKSFQVRIYLK